MNFGATGLATPGLRILVVEDDALIQMLMGETLVSMGHEVCAVAATEAEAVEAATQSQPDLMIVDSHLESGSGLAAVRRILQARAIPHIYVSGDALAAELLDPGAVTLQKPYQELDLARAIARAMASPE
jgi:CheY-like chemotaxis protein